VLIIDKKETFSIFEHLMPANFLRELLVDVQCPVLVVPGKFKKIENVIFLYDGEPSSVFAIKMFSHIFPSMGQKHVEVLIVKTKSETLHVPNGKLMREFMKRRYPEAEFVIEKGDAEDNIVNYLKNKKQSYLAVLGAYRRSRVSRWFRPSMADRLMSELDLPLFIAHNK
jgi:K+-sensing histidine kinase KdpD